MNQDLKQKIYWDSKTNLRSYDHPIVDFFSRQRIDYVQKILNLSKDSRLLDVGCGDGFSTNCVSNISKNVFGIDRSFCMIRNHPMESGVLCGDAYSLPFRDASFDVVWCWEVLHHINNPELIVKEMQRVACKYIVIFEPNRNNPAQFLFSLLKKEERLGLRFTKSYLKSKMDRDDWEISCLENCGAIFPNATPNILFKIIRLLPFRLPLIGISILLVAKRKVAD